MKITLKTTNHDTTQDEQWEKVIEELTEFMDAIDNKKEFYNYNSGRLSGRSHYIRKLNIDIIDEGIDVAKVLQKWAKSNKVYDISHLNKTSSQYFDDFERDLQVWQNDKKENSAEIAIDKLLKYLIKFCQENNLDFIEELAKNDKKNEDRNYH